MNQINFEQDKTEAINQTNDVKSLSEQVLKLRNLEDQIKNTEDNLKKLKKDADLLSGEIIPTMMTEMNISTLKLADGSGVEIKPVYGASIPIDRKEEAFNWLRSKALVRERIESGKDMPSDLFNVFAGNKTKITRT